MTTRAQKRARHLALLLAAAEAHENWEVLTGDDGAPSGVRRKDLAKEPSTLKELADWFVDEFPEEAARILTAEAKTMH